MQTPTWAPLLRNYANEKADACVSRDQVQNHPLLAHKPKLVAQVNHGREEKSAVIIDPLSAMLAGVSLDPLSSAISEAPRALDTPRTPREAQQTAQEAEKYAQDMQQQQQNQPWEVRKQQITNDFTIIGSVTVGASAFGGDVGTMGEDATPKKLDRYHERLRQLERTSVVESTMEMSQKEYFDHIESLKSQLRQAWSRDERVNTLKLAIQCAKLLGDTIVPGFYPSMFVRITDILDLFGTLVFDRLKGKADDALSQEGSYKSRLRANFTSDEVPQDAKETSRNWFYKTACIRELLPRIYIEIALLPCYRFLTHTEYPQILSRLSSIIRGLGDPMVAAYARCYLVLVGKKVEPINNTYIISAVQDTMFTFSHLQSSSMRQYFTRSNISEGQYLLICAPAFDWIMKATGKDATKETFQLVLQQYREHSNHRTVLRLIIDAFDASLYAHASLAIVSLIKSATEGPEDMVDTFKVLGDRFAAQPPPEDQRLPLLNEVWKVVSKCEDLKKYVACASSWLEVMFRHYSEREVHILLGDLTSKLEQYGELVDDEIVRHLESLVSSLLHHSQEGSTALLTSDNLLKVLDVFKGSRKVELCKEILSVFGKYSEATNDAILIHTLFDIARTLHDSVDLLSPEGEQRHVSSLICGFIAKVDFGRDLEQQLNIYVECRAAFSNLDSVKDKLVFCVAELAVKAFRYVRGRHTKKTGAFTKACLAYCHITIPSIEDAFRRLELLLHCAQVALLNQCLPQTDTFLKAAISLIPDIPSHEEIDRKRIHTEAKLLSVLRELLSTLVVAPGHPEAGPFYIVQGLLNALPQYQWQPQTGVQTQLYLNILSLLCTYAQRRFPYKIERVESNDELYGGAPGYMQELRQLLDVTMQHILTQLTQLSERIEMGAKATQSRLVLDLANELSARMEMDDGLATFIAQLLNLAARNKQTFARSDQKYMENTLLFMKRRASLCPSCTVEGLLTVIRALQQ